MPRTTSENRRLLVADDDHDSADSLAMVLRLEGYETYTAYDGKVALERARRLRPHIVILDLDMPLLNGAEVAQTLRRDRRDYVLILLTASPPWVRAELGQDRFDMEMEKPLDVEGFVRTLRRFHG